MIRRRKALSVAALSLLVAGGAAAWAFTPTRAHADPATQTAALAAPSDPWARGPVDRDNMVQGILDYRNDTSARR